MFVIYEIRWHYRRTFYEGGDTMEYIPFDTLEQAKEYAKEHPTTCQSDKREDVTCGIYRVRLYNNYDIEELLIEL